VQRRLEIQGAPECADGLRVTARIEVEAADGGVRLGISRLECDRRGEFFECRLGPILLDQDPGEIFVGNRDRSASTADGARKASFARAKSPSV
jgi:hypothetical protein